MELESPVEFYKVEKQVGTKVGGLQKPPGKERGMGEQSWGGWTQGHAGCGMCAPCLEGGQGSSLGVWRRGVEREGKERVKKAPSP